MTNKSAAISGCEISFLARRKKMYTLHKEM